MHNNKFNYSFSDTMIIVKRMPYGKDDIPKDQREYSIKFGDTVGTRKEWIDFAKNNNEEQVVFIEKDNTQEIIKVI